MKRECPTHPNRPIQLMLHAPDGIVPYLTPHLLNKYFGSDSEASTSESHLLLGVSVRDTCLVPFYASPESNKPRGYRFQYNNNKKNAVPPDAFVKSLRIVLVPSFDLIQDASERQAQASVSATDAGVSIWTKQGRQVLSNSDYTKIATQWTDATAVVSLYDQVDTNSGAKKYQQRLEKAQTRNQEWLQSLLLTETTTTTNSKNVWCPVLLADDGKEDVVPQNHDDKISGYAVVGFENASSLQKQKIISQLDHSSSKTIAVLSVTSISSILECLSLGVVDVIGTNLPTRWALEHEAFCLPLLDYDSNNNNKKQKQEEAAADTTTTPALLDLKDATLYARDDAPLMAHCTCFACRNHTRAYIHHLHQAKELLAQILLMGHNLHHFLLFVKAATKARRTGTLDDFVEHCRRHT